MVGGLQRGQGVGLPISSGVLIQCRLGVGLGSGDAGVLPVDVVIYLFDAYGFFIFF